MSNSALKSPLFSTRYEHAPFGRPGWSLHVRFRLGAGCRAFDLPGHSMNVHHRLRKHLFIPGFTFVIATHQRHMFTRRPKRLWVKLYRNGNQPYVPGWW